jgi:hypothetical protein
MLATHRGSGRIHSIVNQKGNEMRTTYEKTLQKRAAADEIVRQLVTAIRDRQENRGDDHRDAVAYSLGYLSSVLSSVIATSPKGLAYVKDSLQYVKETK